MHIPGSSHQSQTKRAADTMDLCHQSSAMCFIMLVGEDTHPWSATRGGNSIPATIIFDRQQQGKKYDQQTTHTSH